MVDMNKVPNAIDASYETWNADTVIQLTNVPWSADYRDIIDWGDGGTDKNAYFAGLESASAKISNVSYARADRPIDLEIPFNDAYGYNYVKVTNPRQGVVNNPAMTFYYFIVGITSVAPGTTRFALQLDVWTTFGSRVTFGNSYVEHGHVGIANENGFNNYGRDYLTLSEGLDVGNEYQVVANFTREITGSLPGGPEITVKDTVMHLNDPESPGVGFMDIVIASTADLSVDPGSVSTKPVLRTAPGSNVQGLPSGVSYYVIDSVEKFMEFMDGVADTPWISQSITSITAVPNVERYGYTKSPVSLNPSRPFTAYKINESVGKGINYGIKSNWRNAAEILNSIPLRYRKLKKLFTAPYMMIELTTFSGSPFFAKPEAWNDPDARISEKCVFAAPNQKIMFSPVYYNAKYRNVDRRDNNTLFDDGGEYLDAQTQVTNLPTFALVNNSYLGFMASNQNGINQAQRSAGWEQSRALMGAYNSYDQAGNAIETTQQLGKISRNAATAGVDAQNQQAIARGIVSGAQGMIQGGMAGMGGGGAGAVAGAAVGAAANGIDVYLDVQNRNAQLDISNSASRQSQSATTNQMGYVRDTNKGLAEWAARGDYRNAIAGINARNQDAQMMQPSVSGQQGGDVFNLLHGGINLSMRVKMISPAEMMQVCEYWLRYGYSVHKFMNIGKRISVMENFTYWKLVETFITGNGLTETYKAAIRGIFEKGVTVWRDPRKMYQIDLADNDPIAGVRY